MRHAGISVLDYVQQLRIARAQELLQQQPRLTQEQLATACGFASARDWRRVWKRVTTPAKTTGLRPPEAVGAGAGH
jgi:transcriptional regulator GlxA family with amidase domain